MRYLLVINPQAQLGISKRTQKYLIQLAKRFLGKGEVFIVSKDQEELRDADLGVIIFCGGDGTLGRGVQKIYPRKAKIGIVPLGSGCDFASSLRIPKDPKRAFSIIAKRKTRLVDCGRVNKYLFVNTVSLGFDAFINQLQDTKIRPKLRYLKQRLFLPIDAKWCYLLALLHYLLGWTKFEPPEIEIKSREFSFSGKVHLLAITNSFRYGGGFKINPQAKIDDGLLNGCLVLPLSKPAIFRKIYSTYKGTHIFDPRITTFRFEEMLISSNTPLVFQADGETLPPANYFKIEIIKEGLEVFAP